MLCVIRLSCAGCRTAAVHLRVAFYFHHFSLWSFRYSAASTWNTEAFLFRSWDFTLASFRKEFDFNLICYFSTPRGHSEASCFHWSDKIWSENYYSDPWIICNMLDHLELNSSYDRFQPWKKIFSELFADKRLKNHLFFRFHRWNSVTINHALIEAGKAKTSEGITRFNMTKDFGMEATGGQHLWEEMHAHKGLLARLLQRWHTQITTTCLRNRASRSEDLPGWKL